MAELAWISPTVGRIVVHVGRLVRQANSASIVRVRCLVPLDRPSATGLALIFKVMTPIVLHVGLLVQAENAAFLESVNVLLAPLIVAESALI